MDSPRDDMQSLPEGIDALRALVLTMTSERDVLALERDTLQTQNDRLRHLLLQLRRLHFGARSERLAEPGTGEATARFDLDLNGLSPRSARCRA